MFADSPLFRHINSDAHKIRAPIVKAPTLTWHLGFLVENEVSDDFGENRAALKRQLDTTIIRLVSALRVKLGRDAVRVMPCVKSALILFDAIYDEELKKLPKSQCTDRQIGVFEGDQRLVNLRFRWNNSEITVRTQIYSEYFTITVFAEVDAELVRGTAAAENMERQGFTIAPFDELTLNYWDSYTRFILSMPDLEDLFEPDIFQHVFADSRGVVVSDECVRFINSDFVPHSLNWAAPLVSGLRTIVTQEDRYECSASYMLDGRALFLTALGPQRPDFPPDQRMPLTFLLCVQQRKKDSAESIVNPSQLGRLLDRLLLCGTSRLAALLDLRLLRIASRELSQIDPFISDARSAVETFGSDRRAGCKTRPLLDAARAKLNGIGTDFLNSPENISGTGLSYRVEISRYYVTQYRANLPALRIERVEGYQKYDQFIERRLGSTFDFIERLGVRYDRAANVVAGVDQSFTTIQSGHTSLSIESIQKKGEGILVGFLLPYYIIATLLDIFKPGNLYFRALAVVIVTTLMAMGSYKIVTADREVSEVERFGHKTMIVSILLLLWLFLYLTPVMHMTMEAEP